MTATSEFQTLLKAAAGANAKPLPKADIEKMKQAIRDGADVINLYSFQYALEPLLGITADMEPDDRQEILKAVIPQYRHHIGLRRAELSRSFLNIAAKKGNADAIRLLVQYGADPNVLSTSELTPLWSSANSEAFYALLDSGADVMLGAKSRGSLLEAWPPGRAGIIFNPKILPERAKEISDMYRALFFEGKAFAPPGLDREYNRQMWETHFPYLFTLEKADYKATHELWGAMTGHAYDHAAEMIRKGADHYSTDLGGENILHRLASEKEDKSWQLSDAKLLIKTCADLGMPVDQPHPLTGNTPLHYAVANDNFYKAQWLVEAGADVNKPNKRGYPPLSAAWHLEPGIAHYLMNKGAKLSLPECEKSSPQCWSPQQIKALIDYCNATERRNKLLEIYDGHFYTLNAEQQAAWNENFSAPEIRRDGEDDSFQHRVRKRPRPEGRQP